MRNNPYNKNLKEQMPLFMQGPSSISALIANEEQKNSLEKAMISTKKTYSVQNVSFAMISPPILNRRGTSNPPDLLKKEMGQTEVTQELFKAVMGWNASLYNYDLQNPVECVTWYDCISFCNKLSNLLGLEECYNMTYIRKDDVHILQAEVTWDERKNGFRLPTEYEWEVFAKAGTNNVWPGTNNEEDLEQYVWYKKNSNVRTHPVAEKLPNEWGLYDMSGNVWERCWDSYAPEDDLYDPEDVLYDPEDVLYDPEDVLYDPEDVLYNPADKEQRIVRGGSFRDHDVHCRVANRDGYNADYWYGDLGLRLCRSLG